MLTETKLWALLTCGMDVGPVCKVFRSHSRADTPSSTSVWGFQVQSESCEATEVTQRITEISRVSLLRVPLVEVCLPRDRAAFMVSWGWDCWSPQSFMSAWSNISGLVNKNHWDGWRSRNHAETCFTQCISYPEIKILARSCKKKC